MPNSSPSQVQIENTSTELKPVENWLSKRKIKLLLCFRITLLTTHQNSFAVAKSKIQNEKALYCV